MRTAVDDIGTNSTRLLIADLENGRVTDELERRSTVTRLGAGVDSDGRLSDAGMQRVYATIGDYQNLIESHGAAQRRAVLTSAVREAANGGQFAHVIEERFNLTPYVLSGDEEARLTFLGATSERDASDGTPTAVLDIGGGSTEIVIGSGREAAFHLSTKAGVVRQTERHLHTDPPTAAELDALAQDARAVIDEALPDKQRRAVRHAIAVAGTPTALAAIAQRLDPYDPEKVHGYLLSRKECERTLGDLARLPLAQRREVTGLHPDRAPTIIAGVTILVEALKLLALDAVEVSEHDILRGAALGLSD